MQSPSTTQVASQAVGVHSRHLVPVSNLYSLLFIRELQRQMATSSCLPHATTPPHWELLVSCLAGDAENCVALSPMQLKIRFSCIGHNPYSPSHQQCGGETTHISTLYPQVAGVTGCFLFARRCIRRQCGQAFR